jgi:hypothetical protein
LGSEVLSRLLFKEESIGNIKDLKISRNNPTINHLLFADDLLIFGKANLKEASSIKTYLEKYCLWSGQTINNDKSSIRFSKNTNSITASLLSTNSTNPIHLGLPILFGNSKKEAFQSIIDKVANKVEGWRAKTLSQAGRLTLIKSVVAAIPSYAMSTFLLPLSICRKLDRIFKNFW